MAKSTFGQGRSETLNQQILNAQTHLQLQQSLLNSHKANAVRQARASLCSPLTLLLAAGAGAAFGYYSVSRKVKLPSQNQKTKESIMSTSSTPMVAKVSAFAVASALFAGLGGCASQPAPNVQMAVAEAAVQHANTSATSETASAELKIAIAKLASAKQALTYRNYELAAQLAEQAQVDAQVAEMRAQSERSRTAAQESIDAARVLREEIERSGNR